MHSPQALLSRHIRGNRISLTTLSLLLLSSATFAQSSTPTADPAPTVPGKPENAQTIEGIFAVPEDVQNFKQLIAFIEGVDALESAGRSEQETIAHQRKVARTVVAASDQLSAKKIGDQDAMQCVAIKLHALNILQELGEPNADQLLAKAIAAAEVDKRPFVQDVGMKYVVQAGFARWGTWGEKEKSAYLEKITQYIKKRQPGVRQVDMVMKVVGFLGESNGEKHALELLAKLMPHFRTSDDPQMPIAIKSLEGVQRRLNLPGNPIELTGTLLDGSKLDWSQYRGKVVLIDFWATWCSPCRAEVPNILNMYKAYHEKGFEVLGISLDDQRAQAEAYIKQTQIPWPSMFSKKPTERGWQHPMAVRYGIDGIPRAILVDREGKVVHMTASGETLGLELRRLLGEPLVRHQERRATDFLQRVSSPPVEN